MGIRLLRPLDACLDPTPDVSAGVGVETGDASREGGGMCPAVVEGPLVQPELDPKFR